MYAPIFHLIPFNFVHVRITLSPRLSRTAYAHAVHIRKFSLSPLPVGYNKILYTKGATPEVVHLSDQLSLWRYNRRA